MAARGEEAGPAEDEPGDEDRGEEVRVVDRRREPLRRLPVRIGSEDEAVGGRERGSEHERADHPDRLPAGPDGR